MSQKVFLYLVLDIFLPKVALQRQEIPSHVVWKKRTVEKIEVEIPPGIRLVEVYNTSEEDWELSEKLLTIRKVEVDGFAGLVFASRKARNPRVVKSFVFRIVPGEGENAAFEVRKEITLFRPLLEIRRVPEKITVKKNIRGQILISEKVELVNRGEGTAVLGLHTRSKSELQLKPATALAEFVEGFVSDLGKRVGKLRKQYPKYDGLLRDLPEIFSGESRFLRERDKKNFKQFFDDLNHAIRDDRSFHGDLSDVIRWAFLRNFQIGTLVELFLQYVRSVAGKGIILLAPLEVIDLKPKAHSLCLSVENTDLLLKDYPKIDIPEVEIISEEEIELPVHTLFNFEGE